jgi:hypothetical protein
LESRLNNFVKIIQFASGLAAVGLLLWGVITFNVSNEINAESSAVTLLQNYYKLAVEKPEIVQKSTKEKIDTKNGSIWLSNYALTTAESIFLLRRGNTAWLQTIAPIIKDYKDYINSEQFNELAYNNEFRSFVEDVLSGKKIEGRKKNMFAAILISAIIAFLTAFLTFLIQERKLRTELRTEFMAEHAAKLLLESPKWSKRSFEEIKKRLSGFEDDELRKILVRAGAVRFEKDNGELWGLITRNRDDI